MKIVVLDGELINPGDISWAPLEQLGGLTVYPASSPEEIAGRIGNAEVVLSNRPSLHDALLDACPRLRYIGLFATGYNMVDLAAADRHGITVCNAPEYSRYAVAQHTVALLLHFSNVVWRANISVQAGNWKGGTRQPMHELAGKTLGIVGFGSIGQRVGAIAGALGMRVQAAGSRPTAEGKAVAEYVPLERLYAEADVISLHCPLKEETQGMINRDSLAAMKQGVLLLNTARGGLVVEADLAGALRAGKVAYAGLDVLGQEPPRPDSPLLGIPNCVVTPHVAWAAPETRARLVEEVAANLAAWQRGAPVNVVNHPQAGRR